MLTDICTCKVSLTDAAALSEWNGVVHGILSHGQSAPVHLANLLERAPDFAMGHATRGLSALMLGRRELVAAAQEASRTAQRLVAGGTTTPRERLWCRALDQWLAGAPGQAVVSMEKALRLNPADTISMKLSHGIRFVLGDNHGMRHSVEAVMGAHDTDHPLRGYALGCLAFALEETGSYDLAERTGLEALEFAPDDAWGLHAVAHVYDMTRRTARGIALIDDNTGAWGHCNNFRFHVWWHKALLHLDQGEVGEVLNLYDRKIRSDKTDDYRDFANASSLLMRLELDGVDVGGRWRELADLAESRTDDGCLTFADLHYMLALAGDGRENAQARMMARVARDGAGEDDVSRVMKDPGVAAAQGLAAFSNGQYQLAFRRLRAAQPRFQAIGGSHAQRDVFERVTIEAGLRAGALDPTRSLLQARVDRRNGAVDGFAETRLSMIEEAWAVQTAVAAE